MLPQLLLLEFDKSFFILIEVLSGIRLRVRERVNTSTVNLLCCCCRCCCCCCLDILFDSLDLLLLLLLDGGGSDDDVVDDIDAELKLHTVEHNSCCLINNNISSSSSICCCCRCFASSYIIDDVVAFVITRDGRTLSYPRIVVAGDTIKLIARQDSVVFCLTRLELTLKCWTE